MNKQPTKRQKELLEIIYKSFQNEGYSPSFDELKNELSVSSNQAVIDLLYGLEKRNLIIKTDGVARSIQITIDGYNVLNKPPLLMNAGVSYAGSFTASYQSNLWTPLSEEIKINQDMFLVEICGDSMIEAGIDNGDILVAKRSAEFTNRDIVVAQLNEGTTVKRLVIQNHAPRKFLKPENKKYGIILFKPDTKLQAKIIGKMVNNKLIPINPKAKSFV